MRGKVKKMMAVFMAALLLGSTLGEPIAMALAKENTVVESVGYTIQPTYKKAYEGELGSATALKGRTVIVSIYANDKSCSWDVEKKKDLYRIARSKKYLGIAVKWLEKQCKKWGTSAKFIYDWEEEEDLLHIASLKSFRAASNNYKVYRKTCAYLDQEIDSEQIMKDHDADNIIYIFFYNTPLKNKVTSYTYNYWKDSQYPYEFCNMLTGCDGEEEAPAAYAHEILHTFGAPDLYYADTDGYNYGITQKYVNYLERTFSNDIMFTTFGARNNKTYYTKITNKLTELDAYYVGLTKSSKVQKKWGFEKSEHAK